MILFTSDERIFSNLTTIWSICFYHRLSESQKDSVASRWFLFSIIKFMLYALLPNIKNGICHLSLQILDGFHAFDLMLISKHFFNIIFFSFLYINSSLYSFSSFTDVLTTSFPARLVLGMNWSTILLYSDIRVFL